MKKARAFRLVALNNSSVLHTTSQCVSMKYKFVQVKFCPVMKKNLSNLLLVSRRGVLTSTYQIVLLLSSATELFTPLQFSSCTKKG